MESIRPPVIPMRSPRRPATASRRLASSLAAVIKASMTRSRPSAASMSARAPSITGSTLTRSCRYSAARTNCSLSAKLRNRVAGPTPAVAAMVCRGTSGPCSRKHWRAAVMILSTFRAASARRGLRSLRGSCVKVATEPAPIRLREGTAYVTNRPQAPPA